MVKEFKYTILYRTILTAIMIICILGTFDIGKSYGYVIQFILTIGFIWFALIGLRARIVLTEDYIVLDLGKLGKRIERNWNKIERLSRIPLGILTMYKVDCADKPSLTFSSSIANHKELLSEIVKRSPYAVIDDSIRKIIDKS